MYYANARSQYGSPKIAKPPTRTFRARALTLKWIENLDFNYNEPRTTKKLIFTINCVNFFFFSFCSVRFNALSELLNLCGAISFFIIIKKKFYLLIWISKRFKTMAMVCRERWSFETAMANRNENVQLKHKRRVERRKWKLPLESRSRSSTTARPALVTVDAVIVDAVVVIVLTLGNEAQSAVYSGECRPKKTRWMNGSQIQKIISHAWRLYVVVVVVFWVSRNICVRVRCLRHLHSQRKRRLRVVFHQIKNHFNLIYIW